MEVDQESLHASKAEATQVETDLSDETQDFRLLERLSLLTDTSSSSLPKRGEKDFEPNPTVYQADILAASRQAMHNALSHPRMHPPKTHALGFYAPDGPKPPPGVELDHRGHGVSSNCCVCVPNPKGVVFKTIGQGDRWNRIWLLPEEALYLLERGSLDIRWPSSADEHVAGGSDLESDLSIPMSLQAAYACFLGQSGLTLERYSVYSSLRRLGYAVVRASGWDDSPAARAPDRRVDGYTQPQLRGAGLAGMFSMLFNWMHDPKSTASTAAGPLVGTGIHRNYAHIYQKLAIIPWYDPTTVPDRDPLDTDAPFRVVFHIYKPSTAIKKSALPPPDYRIAVVNTREQTTLPTLSQLGALLESTPLDPPKGEKMDRILSLRLRQGYRNVILAVVDQGVASYLRISDVAFGKEKIYQNKGPPSGSKNQKNFKSKKR
ncbi:hypothetical protein N7468_003715 [Penicillium chermesinum]|uniref:tRNA-splicing endonuclease subunit Sen54 N-terminal domain-containing protein n=1 Tax=Penicillium chermesinum TaxID=63820 RepID=A0A9W9P7Q7_9EURO|nr:uncharacterized protein N7468_003715 [Penicillium chermesinum]KAJ5239096.1 hypothetical protein N7468_003715 [Penicillium chermesinum]